MCNAQIWVTSISIFVDICHFFLLENLRLLVLEFEASTTYGKHSSTFCALLPGTAYRTDENFKVSETWWRGIESEKREKLEMSKVDPSCLSLYLLLFGAAVSPRASRVQRWGFWKVSGFMVVLSLTCSEKMGCGGRGHWRCDLEGILLPLTSPMTPCSLAAMMEQLVPLNVRSV